MRKGFGRCDRVGMVEGFQNQFAARAAIRRRAERAVPVEHRGGDAPVVDPEPRSAGEGVEPGNDFRPVRPMPAGRLPRPVDHLVAICADHHRPAMLRPAQDYQGAHSPARIAAPPAQYRDATAYRCVAWDEGNMTIFADREKEFEARFKHHQEFRFKATARRNRLLGLWAAQKMGLIGAEAETYAKDVVAAEFEPGGDKHVIEKVAGDLAAKGQTVTPAQVRFELEHFAEQAKKQLMKE